MSAVAGPAAAPPADHARRRKFRQAAFVYLHVGLLYEMGVVVLARRGLMPEGRGPLWLWLLVGAAIVAVVFWALWFRESRWMARAVWALHALRVPTLMEGAFLPAPDAGIGSDLYLAALLVVLGNLWMLARAGWDL